MRPNVLLIILDAARRDAFEPYGAPPGSTPAVAQLAGRGAAFSEVYSTASWTVPSHSSIFTGLMPRAAGLGQVVSAVDAQPIVRAHEDRLLPSVLRRAGYQTGAASANLWVSPISGFDTGFDDFEEIDSGRHARLHRPGRRERLRWLAESARGTVDDGARGVERALERWTADSRRPFFWFVNLLECHSPYLPPRPYGNVSLVDRIRAADDARRYFTLDGIWQACGGTVRLPEATLERARRLYAGAIRYMDDWLGRILERLDSAGILDETLVIVASDHGENFGEAGLITHGLSLDNRLIHVPFVAAGPGLPESVNSLAELPSLIARSAGLDDHPWVEELPPACGVAQYDPPAQRGDPELMGKLASAGLEHAVEKFTTPLTCAVANGLKVLRRGDREEIYDLQVDPLELAPVDPGALDAGRSSELAGLRAALEHPSVTVRREPVQADPDGKTTATDEELQELEERMRLLGYM